ncbi:MAG TPA: DASS family sodium-coupled anion symporter [Rhodospirillales bacterium]|nr:DASS family sodium-coupled anion symporter [Flavobacteriales bacterium]HIO39399.1 DASS family sodium-coupled anion symporter [Rhodospirillales bacterium]
MKPIVKLGICALICAAIWIIPTPEGLSDQAWQLFAVFVSVIISFILRPFPMGVMVMMGLVFLSASQTITIKEALVGYGDTTVWLVVSAFLIAGAVSRTGLGTRIALVLVSMMGKSSVGLAYSLCGSELILGPVVPSNTARGGGILAPIMQSLATAMGSTPDKEPKKIGEYLTLVGAHANLITAAMFLTGMAANPLVAKAAQDVLNVDFDWATWALGAIVPGLTGLALLPWFIKWLAPPQIKDTTAAYEKSKTDLAAMGGWSRGEKIMGWVFVLLIVLWSTKALHGLHTTLVAWIGVCVLLLTNTEKWSDMVENSKAWDTLIWLGGLLTMANMLKAYGFIAWFADNIGGMIQGIDGMTVAIVLALVYFYSMYMFSMLTAHIAAMVAAFFALSLGAGAPVMVSVALLAYFSNLCACTTYYSTGPVVIYFGLGYVESKKWFATGFLVSLFHMAIWLGLGSLWWKIIGWW